MNNKSDKFIRYFDKQMSIKDKKSFEDEMSLDPNLKEEYLNFKSSFENLKGEIQVDENYFNNLLYKSLKKSSKIRSPLFVKAAFAIPVLILILFLIFSNEGSENWNIESDLSELLSEFSENSTITTNLFTEEINFQIYGFDDILLNDILDEEIVIDESVFDYLNNYIRESDINSNFLNQISSAEFEAVYNEMLKKQIIGEK